MVEAKTPDVFQKISSTFSTTDINTVYDFVKLIGEGSTGKVRTATLKTDPKITKAVKSIIRKEIADNIKHLEEELAILQ